MGKKLSDVSSDIDRVPYDVVASANGDAHFESRKTYAPPEISARVLQKLKRAAETIR